MHVDPPAHDSEQVSVQRTVQVEPPEQSTLPLAPTTTSQSEPPLHEIEHEVPHVPVHVLSLLQSSEQLLPLQPESPISQASPEGHAQLVPVHVG